MKLYTTSRPLHLGLNAHLLSLGQSYRGAGISWYIFNLLTRLPEVSPASMTYSAFLYDRAFAPHAGNMRLYFSRLPTVRPALRILWEQLVQPVLLRRVDVDLLHAMAFVGPLASPCPFVVTIYDLSFLRFPEAFRPWNRWYLRQFTTTTAQRASAVITISESTRRDVITLLKIPPERVHTVYCGVDAAFKPLPTGQVAEFKRRQQLPERFILFLGTLEPRKNVEGLIRAYAHWRTREPDAPPLVVAGGKGWHYQHIFRLVESLGLTNAIHFPGYVPQETLPLWYNAATIFVYPSLFEGFGLPVLEAMACGTPVITSTASSLPEVAGNSGAARLIPPQETDALADTLAELNGQPETLAQMSALGQARAAHFSWRKAAEETVAIYQQLAGL